MWRENSSDVANTAPLEATAASEAFYATDTIPTRTTTTTTTMAAATSFVAACIPATVGGFVRSKSADALCSRKEPPVTPGGSCQSIPNGWGVARRPRSGEQIRPGLRER